jgi:ankyrin repeat protein
LLIASNKVDINSKDDEERTALWHAAMWGRNDIMKQLRAAGAEEFDTRISLIQK